MILVVDKMSETPLYEQIMYQISAAIAAGDLAPQERLPSAHALARDLGIHLHTVRKAYIELDALGYIELAERAAPRVATTLPKPCLAELESSAQVFVQRARIAGFSSAQISDVVSRVLLKGERK